MFKTQAKLRIKIIRRTRFYFPLGGIEDFSPELSIIDDELIRSLSIRRIESLILFRK